MIVRLLTFAVVSLLFSSPAAAKERPNVILFAVDDMCDWGNPLGYAQAVTPNMDSLASQGVNVNVIF